MKNFIKGNGLVIVLLTGVVVAGFVYYSFLQRNNGGNVPTTQTENSKYLPNEIYVIYKVNLADSEKDQVVKSVDAFMNKYKLPHGDFKNSYTLLIERRFNDNLRVVTNPEQPKHDFHAIIYLRKIDGVWQVDPGAGPWCTLEEFEQDAC